jgi:hypothetical protein
MSEIAHFFIVDLVRHRGDTRNLIDCVTQYMRSKYGFYRVGWYVRADQAPLLDDSEPKKVTHYESEDYVRGITDWIKELSESGSAGAVFHVLSYDGFVLARAARLNGPSLIVASTHFSSIVNEEPRFAAARPLTRSTSVTMGVAEGIELAKQVLRHGGHTSEAKALHQNQLRPRMTALDIRARKIVTDPVSIKLISLIVADGVRDGWLGQVRKSWQTGSEYIWLIEQNSRVDRLEVAPSAHRGRFSMPVADGHVVQPVNLDLQGREKDDTGNGHDGTSLRTLGLSDNRPATVDGSLCNGVVHETLDTRAEGRTPASEEAPWRVMELQLRERGIGSPAMPRKFFFDAMEEIFREKEEGAGLKLGELSTKARELAENKAKNACYTRDQNWPAISRCFLRMMIEAEVLLKKDGSAVANVIGGRSAVVTSIHPDFRDRCEATLLETIIAGVGGVNFTDRDLHSLGLALFQQGNKNGLDEFNDRVDSLLRLLDTNGRIENTGGRITVKAGRQSGSRWCD